MSDCAPVLSYADVIVDSTFPTLKAYANECYQLVQTTAESLIAFNPNQLPSAVTFNPQTANSAFSPPPPPDDTLDEFEVPAGEPGTFTPQPVQIDTSFEGTAPTAPPEGDYRYREPGGEPGEFTVGAPDPMGPLDTVTLPAVPEIDGLLPDRPTFYTLSLPEPPTLLIDTLAFEGERPVIDFDVPAQTFAFVEQAYSSDLLAATQARIATMLQGGTGLPAAIEQALFDRGAEREDATAAKVAQEVFEEFAARGFEEPNGILAQRMLEVRQGNQNARRGLNRDLVIQVHNVEIENLRFAVTQGIALEQVLIGLHLATEERRFQAARFLHESFLSIFNAQVALHNSEVQAYQVDAQVYRERLQAEVVKVEAYRAEIEGQKAIGDINKTLAEVYETETRAVLARIEIYVAQINGARAQLEVNAQRLESKRVEVQIFGERVRAYQVQWEGYKARVEARLGNVRAGEIAAQNYGTRVTAWGRKADVAVERARTEIAVEDMKLRAHDQELRRWLGLLEAERSQIAAQATALGARANVYQAAGQIALAASAAADRTHQLNIESGRTEAELHLKNAEIQIQQGIALTGQQLEALKGAAQVISQLASSVFSALNVSASISSSASNSASCGTSYNYSGEIAT